MDAGAWLTPLVLLPGVAMLVMSTSARYGQIHQEFHHLVAEKVRREDPHAMSLMHNWLMATLAHSPISMAICRAC